MELVRQIIAAVLQPGRFFVAEPLRLEWVHETEEIPWEIFRGRLLDRSQTRQRQTFEAWNVYQLGPDGRSAEPLLAVKLDAAGRRIYVTRAVYCYAWEAYDAGANVIESRETKKWVRELVGTVELDHFPEESDLRFELSTLIRLAIVGLSRLPLTSVEAPLPQFSLGQLAYILRWLSPCKEPFRSTRELMLDGLLYRRTRKRLAEMLETILRATPPAYASELASWLRLRWGPTMQDTAAIELEMVLCALFEQVSLTPYTEFVPTTFAVLRAAEKWDPVVSGRVANFLSYLLRHLVRHLTAYDLITFHHQGANYPDALLLDTALKAYLDLAERRPDLFADETAMLRRRALRQGWMLRCFYEGLPVPDAPTSPGENARVLPPPHARVPDEQILMPHKRTKRLYAHDPLDRYLGDNGRALLRQCFQDLSHPDELRELGMAIFLDRPLGVGKAPGEPDQTLLLSYEAFSRTVAERRLTYLAEKLQAITEEKRRELSAALQKLPVAGVPLPPALSAGLLTPPKRPTEGLPLPRPGTVSIHDARKVADDFLFLRTTGRSVRDFRRMFAFPRLDGVSWKDRLLIVRGEREGTLNVYDAALQKRLTLTVDLRQGYAMRRGREYPAAGLRLEDGTPIPPAYHEP